jgi:hypothetical protein
VNQHVGDAVDRFVVDTRPRRRVASGGERDAVDGVDVEHHDRVRVVLRDLFDLDAALGRQHQQMLLGGPVERVRRVVLLGDVARMFDPHALDDVALDVHPQDVPGVQADLVGVGGQFDATRLAAPTDLHLRLDDDRIAGALGGGDRLVDGVGDVARRDRDVEAGEVLLALVLEQVHQP